MKKKQKRKSSSILDRLLTRHYVIYTSFPLDRVMERLHEMSGEYKQFAVVTSRVVVDSESDGSDYTLTIHVLDNPGNSIATDFTDTAYTTDDGGTQIRGTIWLNTNLLGIGLTLAALAGFIAWLAQDTAVILFTMIVLMASPVYLLFNLFIKRQLLIRQLDAALTYSPVKSKSKQPPLDEHIDYDH